MRREAARRKTARREAQRSLNRQPPIRQSRARSPSGQGGRGPLQITGLGVAFLAGSLLFGCKDTVGGAPDHVGSLPTFKAVPGIRIGDFDDPDVGFSSVGGVEVDRDGNVYVLEVSVPEIRVFSPGGDLLRRIGRRGEGPGEFGNPPRFGVMGDTVWAIDNWGSKRITLFDRQGAVLSTGKPTDLLIPLPSGFGHVVPWLMRPDGSFTGHFAMISSRPTDPETEVEPTDSIPVPFVLYDAEGTITDTIGWAGRPPPRMWRPPSEEVSPMEFIEVGGRRIAVPRPPTPLPAWLPLTDGYVLVESSTPTSGEDAAITATRIGLDGDTVFNQAVHFVPSQYTPEDLDSIAAWAARGDPRGASMWVPGQGPPDDWKVVANRLRAEMDFPEFKNPLQSAWLSQDGGIWIRLRDDETSGVASYVLLNPEGRPRGRLELPGDVQVRWNRGNVLWGVVPDEFDVPWVVRFEMFEAQCP